MKLMSTFKPQPQKEPRSNAVKLKKLIQNAAQQSESNKENNSHSLNLNLNFEDNKKNMMVSSGDFRQPNKLRNTPFLQVKSSRSNSESSISESSGLCDSFRCGKKIELNNLKFEKLKVFPLSSSNQDAKKMEFNSFNANCKTERSEGFEKPERSESAKSITSKRFQGLSKSIKAQLQQRREITINNFVMGKKLGKGRFGNVYSVKDKETNFVLALKIINKKQLKEAEMEEQLVLEIKLQSYMKHPNILQMYGFFYDHENIYLMLELAQECLFKDLRRKTCYPENHVAYFTKQIGEGLKYMHSENIIHRDLKPENIMIVHNVVKLADFGWSVYSPLYKRQTFCGTLDYVPPEIVKGDYYDEGVDIWSLGILIFELSFGFAPFEGSKSEEETFDRIINAQFVIPEGISENLRKLIKFMLIRDPKRRLNLDDVEKSAFLRLHEKEGRNIRQDIWEFWEKKKEI